MIGSPAPGLTNQQNWDTYGIAIAGAVAPSDAATRSGILGLVVGLPAAASSAAMDVGPLSSLGAPAKSEVQTDVSGLVPPAASRVIPFQESVSPRSISLIAQVPGAGPSGVGIRTGTIVRGSKRSPSDLVGGLLTLTGPRRNAVVQVVAEPPRLPQARWSRRLAGELFE